MRPSKCRLRQLATRRCVFSCLLAASALVALLLTAMLPSRRGGGEQLSADQLEAVRRIKGRPPFGKLVTSQEKAVMIDLLAAADLVLKQYNITYIIYAGTLLGSHRHMGFIPWDDDIDLLVDKARRQQLREAFRRMAPRLTLYETTSHDKICHRLSRHTNQFHWRWPYLDVSYFEENGTHIWDHTMTYSRWFVYPKSLVLPVHSRPFERLWLPAPRDTLAFLQVSFGRTDICLMSSYSHMIEGRMPSGRKPCLELRDHVPFVHRWPCPRGHGGGAGGSCVHETLRLGSRRLRSETVAEPSFAINDPFSLRLRPGFTQPADYPAMGDTDL